MAKVILCSGKYAKTPYYGSVECIMLYSVEELCYYAYKNAYLLDVSFFNTELLKWIKEELELEELANQLQECRDKSEKLSDCLEIMFRYTGYYSEKDLQELMQILQESRNVSVQEKRKLRADAYLQKGKVGPAADEYEKLLREIQGTDKKMEARLHHNLGVCAANYFTYDEAAKHFKKAYELYANTESYVQYLTAVKLANKEEEYLKFLSEHPESYEDSLEVENRIQKILRGWELSDTHAIMEKLQETEQKDKEYYDAITKMTQDIKEEYREMITYK